MGLNLVSDSGEQCELNSRAWSYLLELASRYGWQEMEPSSPAALRFSAVEAAALAAALDKALNDSAPNESLLDAGMETDMEEAGFTFPRFNLASWLNENRGFLTEFVEFSRNGSFIVQ